MKADRTARPELLVLGRWEKTAGWLIEHTGRWPKSVRFHLGQRVANHALDVLEQLVEARYTPASRAEALRRANLMLEQMRFLLRIAHGSGIESGKGFERAMKGIDETGRMIGGWRKALGGRP